MRTSLVALGLLALLALPLVPQPAAAYRETCATPIFAPSLVAQPFLVATVAVSSNRVTASYRLGDAFACPYDPLHVNVLRVVSIAQSSLVCDKTIALLA